MDSAAAPVSQIVADRVTSAAFVAHTIRLTEVEVAVLAALDERGVKVGQTFPFVEIEVAMDARGYSFRWVRQAVDFLIAKGGLRAAGPSTLQRLDLARAPGKPGKHYRIGNRRRSSLTNL